jgi:hypothetical protein
MLSAERDILARGELPQIAAPPSPIAGDPGKPKTVSFPVRGDFPLADLLAAYNLNPNDSLPHSGRGLGIFLASAGIEPANANLKIDSSESLDARLRRWGFDPLGPIAVDSPARFRALILATLETYFWLHSKEVPAASVSPLDQEDQFTGAVLRETFGHDVYTNSLTHTGSRTLIDGSVLFETAFAPIETTNLDMLRNKTILLSQLEMLRLDGEDGVLNGAEQKLLAAETFDQAAGTRYAAAVRRCSPSPAARIDVKALAGPFGFPVNFASVQDIADRNHVPVETFIRSLVVFHALAISGVKRASTGAPETLDQLTLREAQGGLAAPPPGQFTFGFITSLFDAAVKRQIKLDLGASTSTGKNAFLYGDANSPGAVGPGGFLDRILFDNYGVSCPIP